VSTVSIIRQRNENVEAAVRKAVSLTPAFDSIRWKDAAVLIKPNIVNPSKSGSGMITDARVIRAVTQLVLEKNPSKVIIGEGASVGYDFPGREDSIHCMKVAGVLEIADHFGIGVVDLNRDEQVEIELSDAYVMDSFSIAKTALEADVILSLPVIKTHVRTGITCGLKNMKGILPSDEKKRTHQCGLDRGIVDLNRIAKPHFTVVDGITGLQGTHTEETDKVPLNIIIAGDDVVAVDAVCAAIVGSDVNDILHIQLAAEAGIGISDLDRIVIHGETIEAVMRRFVPYLEAAQHLFGGATIIEKNTCTGCMGELVSTFIYLKKAGFEDRLPDLTLLFGTPEEMGPLKGTPVVVGKCAKAFKDRGIFVPGCPPHGIKITEGACETLGIDKDIVRCAISELHDF
jgi:uncharacterized protein (DUF362 family)